MNPSWLLPPGGPNRVRKTRAPVDRSPHLEENTEGLICWWCVHDLPQLPCFHLPIRYDSDRESFVTIGNFCSWSCAKAYAVDMNSARWGEIQSNLAIMRLRAFGKYVPMFTAPKREALKKFGGSLTIEEFRAFSNERAPPVVFPNDVQLHQTVGVSLTEPHSMIQKTNMRGDKKMMNAIESSESSGDSLKLKRGKPLERSKSKLESSLGITRKAK